MIDPGYRGDRVKDFIGRAGFQLCVVGIDHPDRYHGVAVVVPCWFLVVTTLLPPA